MEWVIGFGARIRSTDGWLESQNFNSLNFHTRPRFKERRSIRNLQKQNKKLSVPRTNCFCPIVGNLFNAYERDFSSFPRNIRVSFMVSCGISHKLSAQWNGIRTVGFRFACVRKLFYAVLLSNWVGEGGWCVDVQKLCSQVHRFVSVEHLFFGNKIPKIA